MLPTPPPDRSAWMSDSTQMDQVMRDVLQRLTELGWVREFHFDSADLCVSWYRDGLQRILKLLECFDDLGFQPESYEHVRSLLYLAMRQLHTGHFDTGHPPEAQG